MKSFIPVRSCYSGFSKTPKVNELLKDLSIAPWHVGIFFIRLMIDTSTGVS